jgi:transketolase
MKRDIKVINDIATQVRRDILRMIHIPKSGHTGGSLGLADFFTSMYFEIMNFDSKKFDISGKNEDLFFLSNGHVAPAWYSVLSRSGYFPTEELATLRKLGTRLQGHPTTKEHLPGVRIASGSLGQGLSVACGAALAKKLDGDKNFVYVLMGDGEIEEGQVWEAALFANARKVDNLIAFVDNNNLQIDGKIEDIMPMLDLKAKWESFGWIALEVDGNNIEKLVETINIAKSKLGNSKPVIIILKTIMGKGVDFMENKHHWHGTAPNDEQLKQALLQLEETLGDF